MTELKKENFSKKQIISLFWEFFRKDKFFMIFVLSMGFIAAGLLMTSSVFAGETLDLFSNSIIDENGNLKNMTNNEILNLTYSCLITTSLFIFYFIFNHNVFMMAIKISYRASSRIRTAVFEKLLGVSISYIDKNKVGELMARATNDVDQLIINLSQIFSMMFISPFVITGGFLVSMLFSPLLTTITIILIGTFLTGTVLISKSAAPNLAKAQDKMGELNAINEEYIRNKTAVYLFKRQNKALEDFDKVNLEHANLFRKSEYKMGMVWPYVDVTENLTYGLIYIIGIIFIFFKVPHGSFDNQPITFGSITTIVLMVRQANGEIGNMARFAAYIERIFYSAARIKVILDEEDDVNKGNIKLDNLDGDIVFENVNFSYVPGEKIIKNFNLKVKKGQKVAIVGPTGSGKTTLINILIRFYELEEGRITIGGQDIKELDKYNLRKFISIVLQEVSLFSESVATNISYGHHKKSNDNEKIKEAAHEVGSEHFINLLPNNFDTIIEDSSLFSSGESQLLALTRAYYSPSNILILDEATSSIDSKTEVDVQKGMLKLMKDKTTFIIAHRLSTIVNSDIIIAMKDGEIIEQGTHKELINKKGFYYNLYNSNSLEEENN